MKLPLLTVCLNSFSQIDRDCEFLEAERIMDYSLLVGLHFRDDNTCDKMGLSPFFLRSGNLIRLLPFAADSCYMSCKALTLMD